MYMLNEHAYGEGCSAQIAEKQVIRYKWKDAFVLIFYWV